MATNQIIGWFLHDGTRVCTSLFVGREQKCPLSPRCWRSERTVALLGVRAYLGHPSSLCLRTVCGWRQCPDAGPWYGHCQQRLRIFHERSAQNDAHRVFPRRTRSTKKKKDRICTINIEDTVLVLIATGHDFLQKFHHRGCVRPFTVPN